MPRNSHRPLVALGALSLLLLSGPGARGADSLSSVAEQFRQGRYSSSYRLARETAESPRRQFLLGVTALRLEKYEEALGLLREVEAKLPLVGDYAALRQAEALFRLKRYPEAAARAAAIPAAYPSSLLVRQAEKLQIDSLVQAGDHQGVLRFSKNFIEKYPSGSDSVEVLFQSGRSREETGASQSAVPVFRSIWIDNPRSPQASAAAERLKVLEKAGMQVPPYSPEELLRRASSLFSQREFSLCLKTLQSISLAGAPEGLAARVSLRAGLAHYRLRHYKDALAAFARAAAGNAPTVSSEARLWHSRTLERQDHLKEAFAGYMELVGEGRKQEYAAEALMEAAGLRRGEGKPSEAARLYGQVAVSFPDSRFISRAEWEAAWCHYLAAEYPQAVEGLKKLVSNGAVREKALYWLGRSLEKSGGDLAGAADCFRLLQEEYPAGFYATWHREQRGIKDPRIPLPQGTKQADAVLPPAFDKARLLASLGMDEDARREASAARKKVGEKKSLIPALAQFYREMGNHSAVISLFQQNLPTRWEKESLPLWSVGYPLAYTDTISQQTAANSLPESLVYALIRAESSFSPGARSPVGAIGLMQLMPATAKATAREKGEFDPERLTVPEYNITLGTRHFRDLLKGHDGDLIYSVAAYNAGSSAVERWKKNLKGLQKDEFIESIPYQETRDYVKKVYASAATYRQLYGLK